MAAAGLQRTGLLSSAESSPSNSTGAGCFSNPSYRTLGPCSYSAHYAKPDKKNPAKVGADVSGSEQKDLQSAVFKMRVLTCRSRCSLQVKVKKRHRNSAPEWGAYCNLGDLGQWWRPLVLLVTVVPVWTRLSGSNGVSVQVRGQGSG